MHCIGSRLEILLFDNSKNWKIYNRWLFVYFYFFYGTSRPKHAEIMVT
jgi:hypothetical protein